MARIRSIKPEFWSSPGVETLDPMARLLYIAMWNWADDNGVGVSNPRELLGFAFPFDEDVTLVDLRRMLVEIRRVFGVVFYTSAGRSYYAIPSWEKHQKFDRRSKGKYPTPEEADEVSDLRESLPSTESHESPPSARRDSVAGTGEQGNRGTGEVERPSVSLAHPAVSDTAPRKPPKQAGYSAEFEQWWTHYPRKVDKHAASKAFGTARKSVKLDALIEATKRYSAEVDGRDAEHVKHGSTWLSKKCWENYAPAPAGQPEADAKAWLLAEYEAGRVTPIQQRTGLHYRIPDLPMDVTGKEASERYHVDAARAWIKANHEEIIRRLVARAAA